MEKNRILAAVLALVMLLMLAMPGFVLAEEGDGSAVAAQSASEPAPEATARDVQEDAKTIVVEPASAVEAPTAAPTDAAEGGDSGSGSSGQSHSDSNGAIIVEPAAPADGPAVTPPPESTDAPKPMAESAVVAKEGATTYTVTFIYYAADGTLKSEAQTVTSGSPATPPPVPTSYAVMGGLTYIFDGWNSKDYLVVQKDLTIEATYHPATTYTPIIDDAYLMNYASKPGKTVRVQIPVIMSKADAATAPVYSNALLDGTHLNNYSDKATPDKFDQSIVTSMGITHLRVQIDTTAISTMPFTTESVTTANARSPRTFVVQKFVEEAAYYSKYGFTGGSVNRGFAFFDLKVKAGAENGTYTVPIKITWIDEEGQHELKEEAYIQITGQKSSGGGGGGGGGGTTATEKPVPKARVYIDSVRTEPENPKAGDKFDVILTLVNSSKTLYLQNMQLTFTTTDDALRPAGEATNVIYIPKIDANAKREQVIPVESAPDIATKLVKMTVTMDFEDKKLAAEQATQDITIPVIPNQKIQVDDPKLPTGTSYVDQEYEIEVNVANTGKVVLNNLRGEIISDDSKVAPDTFYGGNLEGGASKTVSLSPIPLEAGDHEVTIEISYENDIGEKTVVPKKITLSASKEEDYSYDQNDYADITEPEPVQVTPMSIMSVLPKELYMVAGALVLLVIVSMAVSARKRRKRAMEDDEMD